MKAILIPGNGGGTPRDNWFPYLERELPKIGIDVINVQFPDPELARSEYWLPFIPHTSMLCIGPFPLYARV
jgi:hypothetical protein